ncbi:MAG TPA: hypothetical protein VMF67_05540 [Rhizomicrobium sp.]|nr:hypothetical protein [Rhizomicrobium sp.]
MKTSTLLTTMLAGAAVCALSTAPALASPNIHMSTILKAPLRLNSGMHFKSNTAEPKGGTNYTTTVTFSGSVSSHFKGLLFAESWYTTTTNGKCVQPKKEKQKYTKSKTGKIKAATTTSTNPCATGTFTYYGPDYTASAKGKGNFKGKLSAKKFYGYNLLLNENVNLTVS